VRRLGILACVLTRLRRWRPDPVIRAGPAV